jgi:hypothetical protein
MIEPRLAALVIWSAANAGLAAYAWSEYAEPISAPSAVAIKTASTPVEMRVLPDFSLPKPDKKYLETLSRPLFVPSRRPAPPPPPPPPPPKPTMKKGQFQLMGVVVAPNRSFAMLKEIASGKTKSVELGQQINGIRVDIIREDRVELTQYEDREQLTLKVLPSAKGAPAAAAAAGGGAKPASPMRGTPAPFVAPQRPATKARVPTAAPPEPEAEGDDG